MNKKNIFSILLILLCFSCATMKDIELKREAGKSTNIIYDYDWEKVYDAISYIWRHSENRAISGHYSINEIDFAKEEKAIWSKNTFYATVSMGIFFTPINDLKTKVEFVKAGFVGGLVHQIIIDRTIEESKYYLENGQEAYKEYTHRKRLEEDAKIEAEKSRY